MLKKLIVIQLIILLAGTVFAWYNFTLELVNWLQKQACTTGCSEGLVNPFLTPCFYGAIFFLVAFIFSILIWRQAKKLP